MDDGLNMAEELRMLMRWEAGKLGVVSTGLLNSVINRLDALYKAADKKRADCTNCGGTGKISDGHEDWPCQYCI